MEKTEKSHSKYFFLASFLVLIIISLFLIYPFFTTILGGIIITYIFYPVYNKFYTITKNKNISALIISFLILLLLIIPIFIVANAFLKESVTLFYNIRNLNVGIDEISKSLLTKYFDSNLDLADYIRNALNKFAISILQQADEFIVKLPSKLINFFVMFFIIFYLFKDGKHLVENLKKELPLKERYKQSLFNKINDTLYATVYGVLGAAFMQSIFSIIGFYVFKVESPLFLGFLIFILGILPYLGAPLIWLPIVILKFVNGDSFNGTGLLLYSLLIITVMDYIIKIKIIERGAKLHPVLSLLGVLGGLQIFGLFGVIIGPVSIALLLVFFEFYLIEKRESQNIFK